MYRIADFVPAGKMYVYCPMLFLAMLVLGEKSSSSVLNLESLQVFSQWKLAVDIPLALGSCISTAN